MIVRLFFLVLFFSFINGRVELAAQSVGEAQLAEKYFEDGEIEEALELFKKLNRKNASEKKYVFRIASCLDILERADEAIDFLSKQIKKQPLFHEYSVIKGTLLDKQGKVSESEKVFKNLIYKKMKSLEEFGRIGRFLTDLDLQQYAVNTYLEGRGSSRQKEVFQVELAELYSYLGKPGLATQELVELYLFNPKSLEEIKIEITKLVSPSSGPKMEEVLLASVQKNQKDKGIRTLIYEFYVATEDFRQAFIQVKSIDKVFKENGFRVFQFGITMRNNKEYEISNDAFDYIIENHPSSKKYLQAFKEKAINGEMKAFETIPLDTAGIRKSVEAYDELLETFGLKIEFFDAIYRKSNLNALYLGNLEAPLQDLTQALKLPLKTNQRSSAQLLMGDVYLMKKEYDKAKIEYQKVEKGNKDEQIGAKAKFKLGQMDYYKGEFELAQARLSAIKENTSNDISNDALRLNLLIQDNTGLDTTTVALGMFADAQLFIFQNEKDTAVQIMDSILYQFPNHTLTDEILWEKANIFLERNELDKTFQFLDAILENHTEDITADDALFLKAKIYDYNLNDGEKAMEYYMELLMNFPGSLYCVEVRKRIRALRNG